MSDMQEEIKEILDRLENYDNYKYRNDNGLSYKEIEGWEIDLLLNYITNLQEENKRLKELCNKYEEEHNTTFIEWQKDIKANKKAIEYINKHCVNEKVVKNENYITENEKRRQKTKDKIRGKETKKKQKKNSTIEKISIIIK